MTQNNSTDDTLPDEAGSSSAGGEAAVASLTLAEINGALGKDFKDKNTALKAFKDTFQFVGKRKEDIEAEVRASIQNGGGANGASQNNTALESTVKSLQSDLFYTQNPQYKEYADVIKSMGENPAEVVGTDAFKKVFEKVQVADTVAKQRSVVSSNSRLAENKTHVQKAIETANATRSVQSVADVMATAVRESLEA